MSEYEKLTKQELLELLQKKDKTIAKLSSGSSPKITSKDEDVLKIKDEISKLAKAKKVKAYEVLDALAKSLKIKVEIKISQRKPAPIKYQHPDDNDLTWGGRGAQPKWIKEWIKGGKKIEECSLPV